MFPDQVDGTHPYVWVAKGSHAMYPSEPSCDVHEDHGPGCEGGIYQWRTWANTFGDWNRPETLRPTGPIVNVGEIDETTNGTSRYRFEKVSDVASDRCRTATDWASKVKSTGHHYRGTHAP